MTRPSIDSAGVVMGDGGPALPPSSLASSVNAPLTTLFLPFGLMLAALLVPLRLHCIGRTQRVRT